MLMKPSLLILAAGMGSRYGGLKQMDPVGPSGETLLEYSVYDAIRAGFGRVVFVIRKEFHKQFREQVAARFAGHIQIDYVFQELDLLPKGFHLPAQRQKPWGTGHAVWVAKNAVQEPFAVINADDFYGPAAYRVVADYFTASRASWPPQFLLVSYALADTLSPYGTVSRGICTVDKEGCLESVVERTALSFDTDGAFYQNDDSDKVYLPDSTPVSMNFFWVYS